MSVAPERTKEAIYSLLTENLPQCEHVLAGRAAILDFLNHTLHLKTLGGNRITWNRVYRWSRFHALPLLPGKAHANPRQRYCAVSTQLALTAWALAQTRNGSTRLFAVWRGPVTIKHAA